MVCAAFCRSTRESTPCSLIRAADTITTPGSSTKQRTSNVANQRAENTLRSMPTARELEEFFAEAEQPQQRHFMEKYMPFSWFHLILKNNLIMNS